MEQNGESQEREVIKLCTDLALHSTDHGCIFVIELNGKKRSNYYAKVFKSLRETTVNCSPF